MKSKGLGFFLWLFLLNSAPPVGAELFQWSDARGGIHFTDNPQSVPESLWGSPDLIIRREVDLAGSFSEIYAPADIFREEPVSLPREPERIRPQEPEPAGAAQPIIHYNTQHINIVVINNHIVRAPKHIPCAVPEGCKPVLKPNFNDRRFIHPSVFDGGSRQFIHPESLKSARR